MKKAISILLALVLILSAAPAVFAADEAPDTSKWTTVWDVENTTLTEDKLVNYFVRLWNSADAYKGDLSTGKIEISVADGAGYKGSKALKWTINEYKWGQLYSVALSADTKAKTDWTGATEVMFWINNTATETNPVDVFLSNADQNTMKKEAAWYYFEGGQWVEQKMNEWGHMLVPAGYCGWIRLPISSMHNAPADLANITELHIYTEKNGVVYFDNFMINVEPPVSETPDEPSKTADGAMLVAAMIVAAASATGVVLVLKKKEF